MREVFITHTASELPGQPVPSGEIERYLGEVHPERWRLRDKVLRNNGIDTRHYAIDPATGKPTATLAQLQATSIRRLLDEANLSVSDIDLLACGTGLPEILTPGVASAVHGELGGRPIELCSAAGACASGITALKYGYMAIATGNATMAAVGAAERASALLRAQNFTAELEARALDEEDPHIALQAEFLRWMLSDGAGCALLQPQPRPDEISFRIEWIRLASFAFELPSCMYLGARRADDGSLVSYRDADDLQHAVRQGFFNVQQDTRLLRDHIIPVTCTRMLELCEEHDGLTPDQVDWVLPHWSSNIFSKPGIEAFYAKGYEVPLDRVRSNLTTRGNIGSAAVYVMLDDLRRSGEVKPGDGILLVVPESGRFNTGYALLRAV